jgi:hypothetical protein
VTVYYLFYYPYNLGKLGLGDHVGDIEHCYIKYTKQQPTALGVSIHTGGEQVEYSSK